MPLIDRLICNAAAAGKPLTLTRDEVRELAERLGLDDVPVPSGFDPLAIDEPAQVKPKLTLRT